MNDMGPKNLCCLLLLAGLPAASAADIRTWAFEATIIYKADPQGLFGDLRLGDTARGMIRYDLDLAGDVDGESADYWHPVTFAGMHLTIENPRTGEDLRYDPAPEPLYGVSVYSNASYFDGVSSAIAFSYFATPPRPGLFSGVYMDLTGLNVLDDVALPTELNLDDWEAATIYLWGENDASAFAQLYSLTPVGLDGDYNNNGQVEQGDLNLVLLSWGRDLVPDGWVNDLPTGTIDQEELNRVLLGWGNTSLVAAATAAVPEPTTILLGLIVLTLSTLVRTKHNLRSERSSFG